MLFDMTICAGQARTSPFWRVVVMAVEQHVLRDHRPRGTRERENPHLYATEPVQGWDLLRPLYPPPPRGPSSKSLSHGLCVSPRRVRHLDLPCICGRAFGIGQSCRPTAHSDIGWGGGGGGGFLCWSANKSCLGVSWQRYNVDSQADANLSQFSSSLLPDMVCEVARNGEGSTILGCAAPNGLWTDTLPWNAVTKKAHVTHTSEMQTQKVQFQVPVPPSPYLPTPTPKYSSDHQIATRHPHLRDAGPRSALPGPPSPPPTHPNPRIQFRPNHLHIIRRVQKGLLILSNIVLYCARRRRSNYIFQPHQAD